MWRRIAGGLLALALLVQPVEAARARAGEELLRVVAPAAQTTANAHPHVNVVVSFGTARDGTPVDPATFRAKLNGRDVSGSFRPVFTDGVQTGMRGVLSETLLRFTTAPRNRLRLAAQAARDGKGPRTRDVDRVRFGASENANQPPAVTIAASAESAAPGATVSFDASGSSDPDADELAFAWTFSDGATATGPVVSHAFASAVGGTVTASVSVSDGVTVVPASITLPAAPGPDPGRTPGVLRVQAAGPLEFAAVALGATATRSLTVSNVDTAPASQVKVDVKLEGPPSFTTPAAQIDLGPGASATVDVVFAPTAAGHAEARVVLVTSAANRAAVSFLAHGHGGAAPGNGPTLMGVPVFGVLGGDVVRLAPDGAQTPLDNVVGACGPAGSLGTGDACLVNGDCGTRGEVCAPNAGPLDTTTLCSDGQSVFVLSEDSFVDPRDSPDTELSGTIVRFDLDAAGATVGKTVLYRTTEETSRMACDGLAGGDGGLLYLAEFRAVADSNNCSRDERDALVSVNKSTGNARTVPNLSRLDAAAGVPECEFREGVERIAVAADGVKKYAAFESLGLFRVAPSPQAFSPDVRDNFGLHPDGSVVVAVARDRGASGSIEVYRLTEAQVVNGALPLSALAPCAIYELPNNTTEATPTFTILSSLVVGPTSLSGRDGTALATFMARHSVAQPDLMPPFGDVRGTVAFALPADGTSCAVAGLVSLQGRELAR